MINNKELYSFTEDQESIADNETNESNPTITPNSEYPSKILYQAIISLLCLIVILVISHNNFRGMEWIQNRLHYAVNATTQDTFGLVSNSSIFQSIVKNGANLVRLEEITKNISSSKLYRPGTELFQNSVWPVQGNIVKGFGWKVNSASQAREYNSGLTIAAPPNADISAIAAGEVVEVRYQPSAGWLVAINHGFGWYSYYHYLDRVKVKTGQNVNAGEAIAQLKAAPAQGENFFLELKNNGQPVDPLSIMAN